MAFPNPEELNKWKQERIGEGVDSQVVDAFVEKKRKGIPSFDTGFDDTQPYDTQTFDQLEPGQPQSFASLGPITQKFGARSGVERFSGGVNLGADFATPMFTPISVPSGSWQVIESFGGARQKGFIGNSDNRGFGNSVLVKNRKTGEMLRFSHLSKVGVRPGQILKGNQVIALSGSSGNSTGPHSSIMFIDGRGRIRDVLKSRYGGKIT